MEHHLINVVMSSLAESAEKQHRRFVAKILGSLTEVCCCICDCTEIINNYRGALSEERQPPRGASVKLEKVSKVSNFGSKC